MGILDRRGFIAAGTASAVGVAFRKPAAAVAATNDAERFWPTWRGPLATGEAPQARPPVEWGEGKNIRWKVELPGDGKSTPVVWGDVIFLTAAIPSQKQLAPRATPEPPPPPPPTTAPAAAPPAGAAAPGAPGGAPPRRGGPPPVVPSSPQEFVVLALNRKDGSIRWRKTLREELPHEGTHRDGSFAAGSAVTDGKRLFAYFGSRGLYALDLDGKVLWEKDLGLMRTRNGFGEGSSPALHGNTIVVPWDHEGSDFVAAFDAETGKERWRRERDEPTGWATPHIVVHEGRAQVVVGGTNSVRSYNLESGDLVWQSAGLTANVIPSPVSANGIVYAMSGFRGAAVQAVRVAEAKGTISGPPALVWSYDKDTPYVPSPVLYRGGLYFLKSNQAILTCLDAATGQPRFSSQRLDAVPNVYASPVAADGRVYIAGREGTTVVLAAGPELKVLATNVLDDGFDASPALVDGELYLRGRKHLYRISTS